MAREQLDRVASTHRTGGATMLDLILVAVTVGFFVVAVLYVHACDRV